MRLLTDDDAEFILGLVNEPSWIKYIGDRNIHTLDDAKHYIQTGPLTMYEQHGYCLNLVERSADNVPVGMCGLLKRETLEWPDIGFAFCAEFHGQGFGYEAAKATLKHAQDALGLTQIAAVTALDNDPSIALLNKLGFALVKQIGFEPQGEASHLFLKALDGR
ncbi:GNAT family N-acetyltransferase [Paraglaciecola sp. T6c]|uniref:GNAT family N-acetyltransferase n=1 Tax=Pseudoalteromonas atlantica (strain T6c / ATCC BAA-1087) TaxID=3042615 RepID=UPI0003109FB2|nr:GNAT family N-acetyltransferase [Paraglaciecola sp. T6c]